jgi:cytochrome c-type biogenesis protein CcmH
MTRILRSFWTWLAALALVTTVALVGVAHTSVSQQRIAHLESLVRCPACEDLSVAQSQAASAIAVRHEIVTRVHEGASDTEILTALETQYGTGVLLSPSVAGWGSILWVVPVGVVAVGVWIYLRLVRRRT